jgi:hypothetical protein|tara:strand:- start:428 stop:607 length:180 start_codon:yes stop_codon:yes gene_type:complete
MNKSIVAEKIQYMNFLIEEISIQKNRIEDTDTGHIHTTVNVLQKRVGEIQEELLNLLSE